MTDKDFLLADYMTQLGVNDELNRIKRVMAKYGANSIGDLEALLKKGSKTPVINKVEYYVSEDGKRIVGKKEAG